MVDNITTIIRTKVVVTMLHTMTGISSMKVIKSSSNALAVCLISGPEYMYTFWSMERS